MSRANKFVLPFSDCDGGKTLGIVGHDGGVGGAGDDGGSAVEDVAGAVGIRLDTNSSVQKGGDAVCFWRHA